MTSFLLCQNEKLHISQLGLQQYTVLEVHQGVKNDAYRIMHTCLSMILNHTVQVLSINYINKITFTGISTGETRTG